MEEITVRELAELRENEIDFQLIDVRELKEFEFANLGGDLIPLGEIPDNVDKIDREKLVVVHCRSGKRSGDAIMYLIENHGFTNLKNLKGGILAWSDEIDPSVPKY
jgi:adenylyltransferase/sulfurtransferase